MIVAIVSSQICFSIDGITLAPFSYYGISLMNQNSIKNMAGTCLWGDGNMIGKMVDVNAFLGVFDAVPINAFETLVNTALGEDANGNPLDADNLCG